MLNRLPVEDRGDLCYRSTLYLLAMVTSDGGNFFDFDHRCITPDKASVALEYLEEYEGAVKLAYMLWCGLYSNNLYDYDISRIFNTPCAVYLLQALKIRFANYLDNGREQQIQERDKYWEEHPEEKAFLEQEQLKLEKQKYHLEQEIFSLSATIPFLQSDESVFSIQCSINTFHRCKERFEKICLLNQELSTMNWFKFIRRKQLTKIIAIEEKELKNILFQERMKKNQLELSDIEKESLKTLFVRLSLFNSVKASIDKIKYELIRNR